MLSSHRPATKTNDRWVDKTLPEERDPGFNIMSPPGRNRSFKGIALPSKRIGIPWESVHPIPISNILAGHCPGLGSSGYIHETHETQPDREGISFVYNKGPAGQTPFPELIAVSGYFPSDQQQHPPSSTRVIQPSHSSRFSSTTDRSSLIQPQQDIEFWIRAYPHPTSMPTPLTPEQSRMWHHHLHNRSHSKSHATQTQPQVHSRTSSRHKDMGSGSILGA